MSGSRLLALAWLVCSTVAAGAQAAPIGVTDDVGRGVYLHKAAARIVALEPFLTELVFAVGAGNRLVGIAKGSHYPFETFAIPKVRSPGAFILEQFASMKPDLVIVSIDSVDPEQVERMIAMGTSVYVVQVRGLEDIPRLLRTFGTLTSQDAEGVANQFEDRIGQLRKDNRGKRRISVMVELRHRPLTTVSAGHFLSEALEICGADNVFATQTALMPEVLWEQVYRRNPRAIVGIGSASNADEFTQNWSVRRQLEAVREGRLLFVNSDVVEQPTPRTPDDIAQLCKKLDAIRP